MVFKPNHSVNNALKKPSSIDQAYKAYCAHLSLGKTKGSFFWKNKDSEYANHEIMHRAIEKNPDICAPHMIAEALCKNLAVWEAKGEELRAEGDNRHNMVYWQINMRNRHDWDSSRKSAEQAHVTVSVNNENLI